MTVTNTKRSGVDTHNKYSGAWEINKGKINLIMSECVVLDVTKMTRKCVRLRMESIRQSIATALRQQSLSP